MTALRVTVGVATFHRPVGLQQLLDSLGVAWRRLGDADLKTPVSLSCLVVDNDPGGSASSVVSARDWSFPVRYVVEQRSGLGHARNRVLAECRSSDAVIFVDDDQQVDEAWLLAFVQEHLSAPDAVLFGHVRTRCSAPRDADYRWYDTAAGRRRFEAGTLPREQVLLLGDGNTLIPARQTGRAVYADDFAATAGQDTELFARLLAAHVEFRFVPLAGAAETVDPDRLSVRYAIKRSVRNGKNDYRISRRRGNARLPYIIASSCRLLLAFAMPLRLRWWRLDPAYRWPTQAIVVSWCFGALWAAVTDAD